MKRKGKIETEAEAWLDTVYVKLSPGARTWASRPDIRDRWMPFAMGHARLERSGFPTSSAQDLADAIELTWHEHDKEAGVVRENPRPKSHGFIVIDTKTGEILSGLFKRRNGARESLEGILAMSGRAAPIAGDVEYRGGLWYRSMGVHQVMLYPGDTYSPETYRP